MNRTIVFIHGAWVTPRCWEPFTSYFSAHGYTCQTPSWPYHDRPIDQLRAQPDPGLKRLGLGEIIDRFPSARYPPALRQGDSAVSSFHLLAHGREELLSTARVSTCSPDQEPCGRAGQARQALT
jgi:hypothetical protein